MYYILAVVYDSQMVYEEEAEIVRSVWGRRLVLNMADENAQVFEDLCCGYIEVQ